MNTNHQCPCGSSKEYGACCKPFHDGKSKPETAEKLMRSRYSAYVVGSIKYISETNDPSEKESFDQAAAEEWSKSSEWLGLEIVSTKAGLVSDVEGEVEFKAKFKREGKEQTHHEVSLFKKINSKWFYMDGKEIHGQIIRTEPKVGRNDPCACGSGKKSKKCCAA
jgi:SEC-C motif-containing protein